MIDCIVHSASARSHSCCSIIACSPTTPDNTRHHTKTVAPQQQQHDPLTCCHVVWLWHAPRTQPPLACRLARDDDTMTRPWRSGVQSKPWILDALRFAIHVRRGDVVTDGWTERYLPAEYYINLARQITAVSVVYCEHTGAHTRTLPEHTVCTLLPLSPLPAPPCSSCTFICILTFCCTAVTHTLWAVAPPVVPLPQVLDEADCHYNVEVHIETPRNAEGAAEIQLLKASIPHAVILAGAPWVSVLS